MTRLDGLSGPSYALTVTNLLSGPPFVVELLWSMPRSVQQAGYHVAADCEVYLTSPSLPGQGQASVMHKCAVPLMFEQ